MQQGIMHSGLLAGVPVSLADLRGYLHRLRDSGFLIPAGDKSYVFLHRTFQEYFTARYLSDHLRQYLRQPEEAEEAAAVNAAWDQETVPYLEARRPQDEPLAQGPPVSVRQLVDRKAWEPQWGQTLMLLAGHLRADDAGRGTLGLVLPLLEMLSRADPSETNPWGDDRYRHRLGLAAHLLGEIGAPPDPDQPSPHPGAAASGNGVAG
jgi:hypothetical protein